MTNSDNNKRLHIAVVGAGLAGLTAAELLSGRGHQVVVVEKARGPGGRMSTRRIGALRFDHGAQYFTARDPRFVAVIDRWRDQGLVASWNARIGVIEHGRIRAENSITERFSGVPGMSAVCSSLAQCLPDCRFNWPVRSARHDPQCWNLESEAGDVLQADALVITTPPEQARALLGGHRLGRQLADMEMRPCWAVMAEFDGALLENFDAAFVNEGPLTWLASQASKPGRPPAQAWVLHANPDWSAGHRECNPEAICHELLAAANQLPGARSVKVLDSAAHYWRYALAKQPLESGPLWFETEQLLVGGDWTCGSRVEGAFLSGLAAAEKWLA